MTSAQPPRTDPIPYQPAHHPARPPVQPQYWLQSGPMLQQRTWQRSTRSPIMVISSLAGLAFAAIAVVALLVGSVNASFFTARGIVVCPSASVQAMQIGPGTPVQISDERGTELATTTLGQRRTAESGRCELPFSAHDVEAGRGGYVVRVGNAFQETVSESALAAGAVLRPVG